MNIKKSDNVAKWHFDIFPKGLQLRDTERAKEREEK